MKRLSLYRTQLMGVCTLWIMLFHSQIDAPDNTLGRALWYIFVSFGGGFGVNIFLILSGFGLMYSKLNKTNTENWKNWYEKRLLRICPAYLLVSLSFFILTDKNIWDILYNVSFLSFIVDGKRYFWYIFAILFCYLSFPVIVYLYKRYNPTICIPIISALVLLAGFGINSVSVSYYGKIEIFLQRIPCFIFGTYIGYLLCNNKVKEYYAFLTFTTVAGLLTLPPPIALLKFIGSERWGFILLSFIIMDSLSRLSFLNEIGFLKWFGTRSLEIYLVHVSFGLLIKNAIPNPVISLIAYFVCSFVLAEAVYRSVGYLKRMYESKCHRPCI